MEGLPFPFFIPSMLHTFVVNRCKRHCFLLFIDVSVVKLMLSYTTLGLFISDRVKMYSNIYFLFRAAIRIKSQSEWLSSALPCRPGTLFIKIGSNFYQLIYQNVNIKWVIDKLVVSLKRIFIIDPLPFLFCTFLTPLCDISYF